MVVAPARVEIAGAVELFEEQSPGHLVGEGESRERPEKLRAGLHFGGEAEGAADHENDLAVGGGEALRETGGVELPPLLREDDDFGVAFAVGFPVLAV